MTCYTEAATSDKLRTADPQHPPLFVSCNIAMTTGLYCVSAVENKVLGTKKSPVELTGYHSVLWKCRKCLTHKRLLDVREEHQEVARYITYQMTPWHWAYSINIENHQPHPLTPSSGVVCCCRCLMWLRSAFIAYCKALFFQRDVSSGWVADVRVEPGCHPRRGAALASGQKRTSCSYQ